MNGCSKIFRKKAPAPAKPAQTSTPAEPSPSPVPLPSPQAPSQTQPVPQTPTTPPAQPEVHPQPEVKRPVLPSDSAAAQILSQAWEDVKNGKIDLAEMRFEKALRVSPSSGSAYYGLAHIAFMRGQYMRCVEFCKSAELYSYKDPSLLMKVYTLEGDGYLRMGKKVDAADAYRKGLGIDPEDRSLKEKLRKIE
jgi:Flp pilus assembly protein TadD